MSELTTTLHALGFREVDTDLPGGWATRDDVCINIQSRHLGAHTFRHEVTVYDGPASLLSIGTDCLGRAQGTSHTVTVREALDAAGVEVPADA